MPPKAELDAVRAGDVAAAEHLLRDAVRRDALTDTLQQLFDDAEATEAAREAVLEALAWLPATQPLRVPTVQALASAWRARLPKRDDLTILLLSMSAMHEARDAVRKAFLSDPHYASVQERLWESFRVDSGTPQIVYAGLSWFLSDTIQDLRPNRFHALEEDSQEALELWLDLLSSLEHIPTAPWILAELIRGAWNAAWYGLLASGQLYGQMPLQHVCVALLDFVGDLPAGGRTAPHIFRILDWIAQPSVRVPRRAAHLYAWVLEHSGKARRESAMRVLTAIGPASLPAVWRLLDAQQRHQRENAALVMAAIPHPGSRERLEARLAKERSSIVQEAIRAALVRRPHSSAR